MTDIKNKKVAILGWGVDTKDVAPYLLAFGAKITVIDQKPSLDDQLEFPQIDWQLGSNEFGDLSHYDLVVRNPAIYRFRPEIVDAEKKGAKISSKTKLFFDLCPGKIIGVTGTKGKGTTSTLIYEILKSAGKKVYLGGNIGTGLFDFLNDLDSDSWVVIELSSFQLVDLNKSPHISVVLMVTSDHLDWHSSVEEYVDAKKNIVSHQNPEDFAIINKDYPGSVEIGKSARGKAIWVGRSDLKDIEDAEIGLRGEHNRENVIAAVTAARLAGINEEIIWTVVKDFKGLPYRLEEVGVANGVTYINDSFSTIPETTIAATKSFKEPLILIAGGSEKGSDFTQLGKEIAHCSNIKSVILIGRMADRIKKAILDAGGKDIKIIEGRANMEEIVDAANSAATAGDVVLLSPGAASFDMFKSYKDRGNQFNSQISKLGKK